MSANVPANVDLLAGVQWNVVGVVAGSVAHPDELPDDLSWVPAIVPGGVAASVDGRDDGSLDLLDWWYAASVKLDEDVATVLTFDGIATHSTIWIGGVERAHTNSMFAPVSIELPASADIVRIVVCVRSMANRLKRRKPRGRWRSSLVAQQGLRHERTSLIGRAPVYGPLPPIVGLWRPVTLRRQTAAEVIEIRTSVDGNDGIVGIRATLAGSVTAQTRIVLRIGEQQYVLPSTEGLLDRTVVIADVATWWPHTHGAQKLYPWELLVDDRVEGAGRLGFRSIDLKRTGAGIALEVNGVRVFARGGCWVPLDPRRMWVEADVLRAELTQVRDAGLNMVRVVGTLVYEQPEFWSICAELGIMVWQDVMFATTDPPSDPEFVAAVNQELAALSSLVGGNPAFAVLSGGSETQQQPTMLGVPVADQEMPLLQNVIPDAVAAALPGTPYVTSSPSSSTGELHTHVGDGIAHYFGIGGYLRPLSDVRTARVRFAAECLAFAVPPERRVVDTMFGSAAVAGHHPEWKAAVPRDRGSSWDFEDVRDHYVKEIFGVDPHLVRRDDAELYLDYGRAAVCEAVSAAYKHWRRADSDCAGALVLSLRDLVPGAGWGLRDSTGSPKAPWRSLARLGSPICVFLVDDGLDGLTVELANDTPARVNGTVRATLFGASGVVGEAVSLAVDLNPHSADSITLDRILGAFADVNHAYRFGTQTYTAVEVELVDADGAVLARDTHLVAARQQRQNDVGLSATAELVQPGTWTLTVSTAWAAHYVCIDVDGLEVSDSWFHIAPGSQRVVHVTGTKATVSGHVRALNSIKRAQIS